MNLIVILTLSIKDLVIAIKRIVAKIKACCLKRRAKKEQKKEINQKEMYEEVNDESQISNLWSLSIDQKFKLPDFDTPKQSP